MLHNTTMSFILYTLKKTGTGSGITLLCGASKSDKTEMTTGRSMFGDRFGDLVVGPDHYPDTLVELDCLIFGRTVHVRNKQCGLPGALPSLKVLWWSV